MIKKIISSDILNELSKGIKMEIEDYEFTRWEPSVMIYVKDSMYAHHMFNSNYKPSQRVTDYIISLFNNKPHVHLIIVGSQFKDFYIHDYSLN